MIKHIIRENNLLFTKYDWQKQQIKHIHMFNETEYFEVSYHDLPLRYFGISLTF